MYLDYHAEAVFWALRKAGIKVLKWTVSDFPADQSLSLKLTTDSFAINCMDRTKDRAGLTGDGAIGDHFSHVWYRRIGRPQIDLPSTSGDLPFIRSESEFARRGIISSMIRATSWINSPRAHNFASNKVNQLSVASKIGLRIPKTLISNDPTAIRNFIRDTGPVIFKPFNTPKWRNEDGSQQFYTPTTLVDLEAVEDSSESLAICPGIFQEYLEKAHELRVTILGPKITALKISTRDTEKETVDWRVAPALSIYERAELPPEIETKILNFMNATGLVFGCMDLVVMPNGEHVFLEINPAGQFLWKEDFCPKIPMLRDFTKHFARTPSEISEIEKADISLENFAKSDDAIKLVEASSSPPNRQKINYQYDTSLVE